MTATVYGVDHGVMLQRRGQAAHRAVGLGRGAAADERGGRGARPAADPALDGDLRRRLLDLLTAAEVGRDRAARSRRLLRPAAHPRARADPAGHPLAAVLTGRRVRLAAMQCLARPEPPRRLPGTGPACRLHDTATGAVDAAATGPDGPACTSAASRRTTRPTWVTPRPTSAFDLLNRAWRDAGHDVQYVQNVTDVDDPLLERAERDRRGLARPAEREISCSATT